jgi:hypothetical protein
LHWEGCFSHFHLSHFSSSYIFNGRGSKILILWSTSWPATAGRSWPYAPLQPLWSTAPLQELRPAVAWTGQNPCTRSPFSVPCDSHSKQPSFSTAPSSGIYEGRLISLWLYKENNKLRDWKNVFTLYIVPGTPHTYDFVVLTS